MKDCELTCCRELCLPVFTAALYLEAENMNTLDVHQQMNRQTYQFTTIIFIIALAHKTLKSNTQIVAILFLPILWQQLI